MSVPNLPQPTRQTSWKRYADSHRQYTRVDGDAMHRSRVANELKQAGVSRYGMMSAECKYLPQVIHPDEHIGGVIYGQHEDGFVVLVATDKRIIFLDNKPLFISQDEITYDVVSGVGYGHVGLRATVTLHTRVRDYTIKTFNMTCARRFIKYIESRSVEHQYFETAAGRMLQRQYTDGQTSVGLT